MANCKKYPLDKKSDLSVRHSQKKPVTHECQSGEVYMDLFTTPALSLIVREASHH
jgi:hypothetical protein